ncbi:sulfurtransferase TusA family protein [Actinobacillus equuli subsp. haemolyticus]|uniref:sulfurtransferase TusA family protein n=1 Tax=Actinobacillus equuli TaxID=718 RepID=UPI0024465EED|nr:sulfurtransferase TusA family protein [Actinobacillus equuli]WGE51603.1 sulfurtransferase TusA family protein [Actinobacillus equuli subsp. haemolyticus]
MNQYQLDLTAYSCPLPLLMAKKALVQLPQHATLVIYLNMASSTDDFELLCEQYGYQWLGCQNEDIRRVITIKK